MRTKIVEIMIHSNGKVIEIEIMIVEIGIMRDKEKKSITGIEKRGGRMAASITHKMIMRELKGMNEAQEDEEIENMNKEKKQKDLKHKTRSNKDKEMKNK